MKRMLFALSACGHPSASVSPTPPSPPPIVATPDAAEPSQDEKLAAIQKAMNELAPASQGCWAAAAVDRFDIEGELEAQIAIDQTGARTTIVRDTARAPKLSTCLAQLLDQYSWAPPLRGQTIQLPFKFRAPDGQSMIDRRLVPFVGQGKVSVAVLLDENNSGNAHASMFEVAIAAGGTTGLRKADRAELWLFQSWKPDEFPELDVTVAAPGLGSAHVKAGDMMYVPAGAVREVRVTGGADKYHADLRAVVVVVPGGREGAARGGALPTAEDSGRDKRPLPVIVHADTVKQTGPAKIFVDATVVKGAVLAASILQLTAGAKVPEHRHANETELLYVWSHYGAETSLGTMTIAGTAVEVTDHSVIQIPPNTEHGFTSVNDVIALQIYTPAGPEQRFKAKP